MSSGGRGPQMLPPIRRLVDAYSPSRILLSKETVTLYEDVQEFWVADTPESGGVIGCGALHVMWEDLAEVRALATDPRGTGRGVGNDVLAQLLSVADELGVARVFCLTCEVDVFAGNGFEVLEGTPVEPEVYA
jgi:amino-acid N-acetyltransferase